MNTRQRILDLIRKNGSATTSQLSVHLDMTLANIRHHLSILLTIGLVEISGNRILGRGRPEKIYSIRKSLSNDGLENILKSLLNQIKDESSLPDMQRMLERIAEEWSLNKKPSQKAIYPVILNACVKRLNELKYNAHWEAGREGPSIQFDNCPYFRVINAFPELCGMDGYLLGKLTDLQYIQTMKLEKDEKGLPHCVFISRREGSSSRNK